MMARNRGVQIQKSSDDHTNTSAVLSDEFRAVQKIFHQKLTTVDSFKKQCTNCLEQITTVVQEESSICGRMSGLNQKMCQKSKDLTFFGFMLALKQWLTITYQY
ncbi:Hypothetical_protein [Hexamita inflata]|uniref:Hypothetical_protein n=1 Tax=Hexamita inflata TaxID=28002 RepID=A0AA86R197_9EUKA|nr:Hypothetical protein HINF_LOCUS36453 [Hexamita inflata]CAI9948810.1 Hypothetical protein HINF_LOCUS36455 [Hexamita inflata]CAI9967643.1 Hypothetical protein HINF_LOCUS55288 [Hexamita inflata]CAI9967645.1 Hypothetical protein HINF_LOCUS55290 [Hexamita inflata]CAI9967647.1 Hypothetical protein HINF_LOCUS55292 [Hexamita inflata]